MISPQLRAMRLRAVNNKHFAFIREARKELREVSAGQLTEADWASARVIEPVKAKLKYDG